MDEFVRSAILDATATKGTGPLARKPSLSKYLRDARMRRDMSVAELAEKVGVTAPCIYFWEAGKTRPRDVNLTAVCKALKLPIRATREIASA